MPLIVEYTPTRHRTILAERRRSSPCRSASWPRRSPPPPWCSEIGWRGLAMLGFLPLVPALLIALIVPESGALAGDRAAARPRLAASSRRTLGVAASNSLPQHRGNRLGLQSPPARPAFAELAGPAAVCSGSPIVVWFGASTANYGVFLWGPTIVALLDGAASAKEAALSSSSSSATTGLLGRAGFSLLPQWLGRRRCGEIMGYGIAVSLGAAASLLRSDAPWATRPSLCCLRSRPRCSSTAASPTSRRTRPRSSRCGSAPAASAWRRQPNGVGKIAGPLCLASDQPAPPTWSRPRRPSTR